MYLHFGPPLVYPASFEDETRDEIEREEKETHSSSPVFKNNNRTLFRGEGFPASFNRQRETGISIPVELLLGRCFKPISYAL
jgi:hypothetical protein